MSAVRKIDACRGFTLVELLVALTIMAVVLGLLTNSMRFSMKTVSAVESRIASVETLHQVQRALKRQLQMAVPVRRAESDAEAGLEFAASQKEVEFIAPLPGLAAVGELYRISLRIEDDPMIGGDGGRLLMSYRSFLDASGFDQDMAGQDEIILLEGFSVAAFDYLDTRQATASARWENEWRHTDRLPDLVRLRVNYADAGDEAGVDVVVAIKATSPSGYGRS